MTPTATPSVPGLVALLVLVTSVSQFYRASSAVIGPELMAELDLSPQALGAGNASFFVAIGVAQIPVGLLFDRVGPRRTVTGLAVLAVAGALLHGVVEGAAGFVLARFLLGLGCAANFMAAVLIVSRWIPADRLATTLGWIFAGSNLGPVLAASPLALAADHLGWRPAIMGSSLLTAAVAAAFYLRVRDAPPGAGSAPPPEGLRAIARGLARVWRTAGLGPVLAIHLVGYATVVSVLYVWAAPFLADVYGLGTLERGHILLAMTAAQIVGLLCYGPLDRLLDTRKRVVLGGAGLSAAGLLALAALERPPLAVAVGLLVVICLVSAYGIVIVAHGRSLFPPALAGRGVTTVNLGQVAGCALLPLISGAVISAVDAGAPPLGAGAYRAGFGSIGLCVVLAALVYLRAPDRRPSDPLP